MSCLQAIAASQPASSLWAANTVKFGLPYFSLTMTLNMLVTTIIITRLLLARRKIRSIMGDTHGHEYTSVAAMLVESALPTALVSLVLIALYAQGNTAMTLFFPLLPQVQVGLVCVIPTEWSSRTPSLGSCSPAHFYSGPSRARMVQGDNDSERQ